MPKHAVEGRDAGNSRNGTRLKTVLSEVGPVKLDVPRDRDASFEPQLVKSVNGDCTAWMRWSSR